MTRPSSQSARPATLWPPPRTATRRSLSRAKLTARDHVGGAAAADDQPGAAVDRGVPDPAGGVVVGIARADGAAGQPGGEGFDAAAATAAPLRFRCGHGSPLVAGRGRRRSGDVTTSAADFEPQREAIRKSRGKGRSSVPSSRVG